MTSCQETRPPNTRKVYYIKKTTNELFDYSGTVPSDIVWIITDSFDPNKPEWGVKARTVGGWYFTNANANWVMKFQSDSGEVSTIKEGSFSNDGTVKILRSY
jgi:hypothetical protein